MTFSHYSKSLVQAGSAQLARSKSYRVLACGQAQSMCRGHTQTHACARCPALAPAPSRRETQSDPSEVEAVYLRTDASDLVSQEAAMGLCAKKGGRFELSRTASISPRPPSPAVPRASSFDSTSGAGDFGHPATSTRSSWGDFAQRGERARDWGGGGRQRECWAARLHVAMREEKRGKGALTVSPLRWYTSLRVDRIPRKAALRRC